MKITKVETLLSYAGRCNLLFVKICTDANVTGIGEATLEGKETSVASAIKEFSRYLIGKDPERIEHHWQVMYRGSFWRGGAVITSAISGIDQALWDIKGKVYGVPVYELLGGPVRNKIRFYTHARGDNPEELAESARSLVRKGWDALKYLVTGPFENGAVFKRKDLEMAGERMRMVREAVGDDVDIMLDCHGRFTSADAIKVGMLVEPYKPLFFEEPVPPEDVDAMVKVSRSLRIPIATGERLYTRWGFKELLYKHAVDVIQPDLCHAGGISEVRRIAALAEIFYVKVAPHNPLGPVATAACVQLDAAIPNFLIQEVAPYERIAPWVNRFVREPIRIEHGYATLPKEPGLGVELDEEEIKKYPYKRQDLPRIYAEDGSIMEW